MARDVGITKGTVSKALNGSPGISEDLRRRVRLAADRLGYQPLSLAQAIKTGRSRALGLVLQEDETGGPEPFLADFLSGVSAAASAQNWTLTIAFAKTAGGVRDTLERLINERKADGFILPRSRLSDLRVDYLRQEGVPFVLFGRAPDTSDCAWFDIAGEDAVRDAVLRLVAMGHRRIGFLNGGSEYMYAALRDGGYRAGLETGGIAFDPDLVRVDAITKAQGAAAARDLLSLDSPPTAIVAAMDHAALGIYATAAEWDLQIGQDLSVIAYDGVPEGEYARPALTTYSVDRRHAGERLATLLIERIRGEQPENLRELAPAQLIVRGSDGPPAVSPQVLARRVAKARQGE